MLITQAYDGRAIAEVATEDPASLERKLTAAVACFAHRAGWLPPCDRIAILRRLTALVQQHSESFALLIAQEGGKPLLDARVEVARAVNGIESAIGDLEHLAGVEVPMGLTPASAGRWAFTTREPIGVVLAISAFNHPLNLIVHQVVPAIATGCPVLIKPAPATPLTCLKFVQLVHEAGLAEPWCQMIFPADTAMLEVLVSDPRIAFFSFIGSAGVGWYLRSKLAPGVRCALEHGGAAPVIVDRSAALDRIIAPIVKGGYYHAGQVCVSVQRIFVHAEIFSSFVERFAAAVQALNTGDPLLDTTEVGPLILPKEVERVKQWVAEAAGQGAKIAVGGFAISDRVYAPTVLLEPPPEARVSTKEVFGPVTCIYAYTELDEAIARANSLPFAFQSAVFTQDITIALDAARKLDASAVMVNDHTAFRTDWMPFAGRHASGYGIGGIPYTMHELTQSKMIVLKF
jgi:acyl-CoA reductase-like NAD-dependent aldehyde dehydrogenase